MMNQSSPSKGFSPYSQKSKIQGQNRQFGLNIQNYHSLETNLLKRRNSSSQKSFQSCQEKISKSKIIQKKEEQKKNQTNPNRGGNCVASNCAKLFLKLIYENLTSREYKYFEKQYISKYQIFSQKENILAISLLLLIFLSKDFKNQEKKVLQSRSQQKVQNERLQIFDKTLIKLNQQILSSSLHSRQKLNHQKDDNKTKKSFHIKNISIYNRLSDIINRCRYISKFYQNYNNTLLQQKVQNTFLKIQNIEEQNWNLSFIQKERFNSITSFKNLLELLQPLYERKERQFQKASDKLYGIFINQDLLASMYQITKLNIQDIVVDSLIYIYRRNINSKAKKCQRIMKEIIQSLEQNLINFFRKVSYSHQMQNWQFIIGYMSLSIVRGKKQELFQEFIQNIKRKIKYLDSGSSKQYNRQYYEFQILKMTQLFNKKSLTAIDIKQWVIDWIKFKQQKKNLIIQKEKQSLQMVEQNKCQKKYKMSCETKIQYNYNENQCMMNQAQEPQDLIKKQNEQKYVQQTYQEEAIIINYLVEEYEQKKKKYEEYFQ